MPEALLAESVRTCGDRKYGGMNRNRISENNTVQHLRMSTVFRMLMNSINFSIDFINFEVSLSLFSKKSFLKISYMKPDFIRSYDEK